MNPLARIRRVIASKIPGSAVNIELAKIKMEKELRDAGYSRDHAAAAVAEHFRRGPR